MDAGREPAKLWFHCLMAIALAGQMVFIDSGDALRSAAAEVTLLGFKGFFFFLNDQCLQQLNRAAQSTKTYNIADTVLMFFFNRVNAEEIPPNNTVAFFTSLFIQFICYIVCRCYIAP